MQQSTLFKTGFFILLLGLMIYAGLYHREDLQLQRLYDALNRFGVWAPLFFIGIYITATVLFLPGSVLTIAGGLLFGPVKGTLYNLTGAVIGASLAFLIARYLASDWVAEKTGGRLKSLINGVEEEGWRFVAVVRLVPLFPFNLLNYALGLTKISIRGYIVASAIFMLPGTIAYTYIGSLGHAAITGQPREIVGKVMIGIGLLIIVGMIPWVVKKLRHEENID